MRRYRRELSQEWGLALPPRRHVHVVASIISRWKLVALCAGAAVLLGVLFTALKPVSYTASTQLLVYNRELQAGPEPVIAPGRADTALVENMIEIFKSRNVLTRAIESLKLSEDAEIGSSRSAAQIIRDWLMPASPEALSSAEMAFEQVIERFRHKLSIQRMGTSHTVLVMFTSSDPNRAAEIANEIALSATRVLTATEVTSAKVSPLRERLQGLGPSAYVISAADPPIRPDGPRRVIVALGCLVGGLGVGSALAALLGLRDRSLRTARQVEEFLGLECFGTVARLPRPTDSAAGKSAEAEADAVRGASSSRETDKDPPGLAQALDRALVVMHTIDALRIVGVTSTGPGSGPTTIALGLAQLAARVGKTVLVIGPTRQDRSLNVSEPVWNAGEVPGSLRAVGTGLDFVQIENASPAGWVSGDDFKNVLREVAPRYDLVILDLPPLSAGRAVSIAAQKLDGLLLVLRWGEDDIDTVQRALDASGIEHTKFAGVILNMAVRYLIGRYGDKLAEVQARLPDWSQAASKEKENNRGGREGELAAV